MQLEPLDVEEYINKVLTSIESLRVNILKLHHRTSPLIWLIMRRIEVAFRDLMVQQNYLNNGLIDPDELNQVLSVNPHHKVPLSVAVVIPSMALDVTYVSGKMLSVRILLHGSVRFIPLVLETLSSVIG